MKLVIKRSITKKWFVILLSRNGKTLMQSEMYNTKQAALKMIHSITNYTGTNGLTYEDNSKNSMVMIGLVLAAFLALLQTPSMAADSYERTPEGIIIETTWHNASWTRGGYEDRETIVTTPKPSAPRVIRMEPAPRPAAELPKPHKSVLVPAINYPERITYPEPAEPKKLSRPSMGWQGPRMEYTAYPMSSIVTRKPLAPQRTRR